MVAPTANPITAEPKPDTDVETPSPRDATPTPTVEPQPQISTRRTSLAGFSISSLMNETVVSNDTPKDEPAKVQEQPKYDPATEQKISSQRDAVIAAILEERPRFVVAFEKMHVEGHTIMLEVPSQTLYEEIMRSKTEILLQIVRTAGINGSLEMEIKVNEQIRAARPIKLEDRIKYMIERNPQLATLKSLLDMEYE
ncbi:MAG: DNA polymerase III subunit gamma/tau [Rikenellaceae bacterium]|nr:DNA polymerase III subunit gamma/tau [Rikenellaceae bacterium]